MCINFDNKNAAKAIQNLNQPARRVSGEPLKASRFRVF
jgi:hypothetical protein